jgi:hypothetical protein
MNTPFKTRITDLYGIRLPIVASGLMWLADPVYVAAVARAGLIGFMTAASFPNVEALRAGIRRCRELSEGKPFGVNIMIRVSRDGTDRVTPLIDAVIEEGVKFVETAGNNPEAYIKRLKDAGIIVVHKVPGVMRYVKKAESLGADAVIVIGAEAGGHPGVEPVGTMVADAVEARGLAFSPDGARLVTSGVRTTTVWDVRAPKSPRQVQVVSDLPAWTFGGAFSSDVVGVPRTAKGAWGVVAFRPDGTSFVLAGGSGAVDLPDFDPALSCRQVTDDDLDRFERLFGAPSACVRVPGVRD